MGKKKRTARKSTIKQSTFKRKIIKGLWIIFGVAILSIVLVFGLISAGVIGYIPPIDQLQNPIAS